MNAVLLLLMNAVLLLLPPAAAPERPETPPLLTKPQVLKPDLVRHLGGGANAWLCDLLLYTLTQLQSDNQKRISLRRDIIESNT